MKKLSLLAGAAALGALILPATANAQGYGYDYGYDYGYNQPVRNTACERQRKSDKAAGTIIGAIGGALIGGAIGNNVDDGDAGWYRSGRRGHHGHRRSRWHYYEGNGNSDEVAAGAILGAIVGGVAGNALADSSSRDCVSVPAYGHAPQQQAGYPHSPPPSAYRQDDLYGGPQSAGYPDYDPYPEYSDYPDYPDYSDHQDTPPPPPAYRAPAQAAPPPVPRVQAASSGDCRTIQRQTRAPDGRIVYDPITTCRDPYSGAWQIRDGVDIGN